MGERGRAEGLGVTPKLQAWSLLWRKSGFGGMGMKDESTLGHDKCVSTFRVHFQE